MDVELIEQIEADDEILAYAEEDWNDLEQTEVDKVVETDFPLTIVTRQSKREETRRITTLTLGFCRGQNYTRQYKRLSRRAE